MPRSSRHKSSKHSSRDARDYSDSEKDSSSKDRKSRDESSAKVSKESASGEKRKNDSKDNNGDYVEDYSTLKRRRERVDDGNDRWNGGDDDRGEGTKKSNEKLSEPKSKRRDYGESDEVVKKSSGKTEGKHRESSSRKEGREGGGERERDKEKEKERERYRRGKEGKTEKFIDVDDLRTMKQVSEKTELNARDLLRTSEMDSLSDRRIRKKRDDFGDGDKNHGEYGDSNDRRLSSREDVTRDGRPKEEKHKDDRYRDKYREDVDRESRHRDDKLRDERYGKDHISNKSDFKNSRDDKDNAEMRSKKHKAQDGDRARERDHDPDRDHELNSARDNDRGSYQHERDRNRDRDRDHESDWDRDRDRDRERDRDKNIEYDVLPTDDRNARYKDSRGRKRSPDDYDDYADTKSRGVNTAYLDMEKKSMNSRVGSDADRGKSQSRQAHADNNAGGNKRRTSPNTSSPGATDEYRQLKQEDLKYKDTGIEHRPSKSVSSRDVTGIAGPSERNSKYRNNEKHTKMDEDHMGELSIEKSSSSKASPMVVDRSPSSTSLERRYTNRPGVRRNLDSDESMRRSNASMGSRDLPSADDRPNRDLPFEKSSMDDSTSVDSSFYNRTSQSNSTPIPPPSFRGRAGSPSYMDSLEDGRISAGSRYKRSGDPNIGRGQGNAWRGPPNWSSPLPNGFIPFQHGPHPGAFQAMLPQFPAPLFGVRPPPSMEISHSGIPYHIADADRFASHLRPLGWQNIMDPSGPAHMHGWDGNNGVFRDESHLYGGPEWDQSRHSVNGRGWDGNADVWKAQNGDMNLDMPSTSLKDDFPVQVPVEEVSVCQRSQMEKAADTKTSVAPLTLTNDSYKTSPKIKKTTDPPKSLNNDNDHPYGAYLSQLDISAELADPELYTQFTSLLGVKEGATVKEDATMLVNLKDGARAIPKASSILLSSSLFPVASDSVFQRAMGIYKRQKASLGDLPFANGGIIDVILESKMGEEVPPNNEASPKEPVAKHIDQMSETNANAGVSMVSETTPIKEAEVDVEVADLKLESSDEGLSHEIPDPVKPVMGSSEDGKGENISSPSPIDVPNAIEGDNCIGKTETEGNTLNSEEEGEGKCGVLISPKTGTNESESVFLSRIHHSPESTH